MKQEATYCGVVEYLRRIPEVLCRTCVLGPVLS